MLSLLLFGSLSLALGQSGPWPSIPAFYPLYPKRKTFVLNGTWSFGIVNSSEADIIKTGGYADISTPNTTSVPSCFDIAPPGIKGPRTTAFYRSVHECTTGAQAKLQFYAVNFFARVFVDGVEVGNHSAGPYTPFSFISSPCSSSGKRELALMVNNEFDSSLSPTATGGDFYFYGGIIRPVVVSELPGPFWIERVEPVTVDVNSGKVDVRVVMGGGSLPDQVSIALAFNGGVPSAPVLVALNKTSNTAVLTGVTVPNAKPWTVGQGNLFTLTVSETVSGDSFTTRSGLRKVGTTGSPSRLTINGEVVKLKGYNRHSMWPDTGAAVTPEQERVDLSLVQGVNANYVRGGHYPQSQHWLDLLDEAGILLWEEALGPGVQLKNIQDPFFMQQQVLAVTSMVHTSIHHPSVILHGFFNEGPSSESDACVGYQALADTVRSLTSSRLVTWASDKTTGDKCLSNADVVSFNNYPGWYGNPTDVSAAATTWKRLADWASTTFPSKPFTVSETGGGGVYEWVNETSPGYGAFWSQKYQSSLVGADVKYLLGDDRVSGLSLWLLTDFKVDDESCGQCSYAPHPDTLSVPWNCTYINVECGGGSSCLQKPCGRPGGENHKGAVDFWRRKKISYATVSALYGA